MPRPQCLTPVVLRPPAGLSPGLALAQGRCPLLDFSSLSSGIRALLVQRLGLVQVFRFSSCVSVCVGCCVCEVCVIMCELGRLVLELGL
jgi:hypothetical protein